MSTINAPITLILRISRAYRRWFNRYVVFKEVALSKSVILGAEVDDGFYLAYPKNLNIGEGTVLNGRCLINAKGGVSIGRYCHIGSGLTIYSSNHNYKSTKKIPYDEVDVARPVSIGNAVWIGASVSICPGAQIGDGAVIGMGAVVRGIIPRGAIVVGNPACVIGYRDIELFDELYLQGAFC